MAPKKKETQAADILQDGPAEEEEPGPGKAVITIASDGVRNLPRELQTLVGFTGFCKEFRTGASSEPGGWEFTKDKIIRLQSQDLYNDIVGRRLVISLRDAAVENAVIGKAELSLLPLLHDSTEVAAELELELAPEYFAKWWKDDEAEDPKAKKDKKQPAPTETPKEREPLFDGEAPPSTTLSVKVSVEELLGPEEDRDCWTVVSINVAGIFALPDSLTSLGVVSPDDFQAHPVSYQCTLLDESLGEGVLTKAAEVRDAVVAEEATQEDQLRFFPSVRFRDGHMIRYRGSRFISEFRHMLSNAGGVYLYFDAEEKPPADPKKPNPPETAELTRQCSGRAWLDLRSLVSPGACKVACSCMVEGSDMLQSSRTFAWTVLELSFDVTPPEHADMKVHAAKLLPVRDTAKFASSTAAAMSFEEAITRGCQAIHRDCAKSGSVEDAITQLKEVNSYEDLKQSLRESIICVFRERLRKETSAIPGRPLRGKARDDFISNTYAYLQITKEEVLAKLHPTRAADGKEDVSRTAARYGRLAYEAELIGNWDRAASLLQNRFLIQQLDLRSDPEEWVAFAKFCARRRGRQTAAEEAVSQASKLMQEVGKATPELILEVDLFLACLLLDRGRYEDAIAIFQEKHDKDFANPMFRFLLGLALFLRCKFEEGRAYLESSGKPREWFKGLPDEAAVVDKLKAFRKTDGPPNLQQLSDYLDKLLSFGLPGLVFTFLDQSGILPQESLQDESMVLVDAKALALDRDLAGAIARLEPMLSSGSASYEVWKLAGESYVQLQEYDKALQALQTALSFDKEEDPALHIRLGSVLLVKKRWKQARDAFLRSIQARRTAEAWSGVAYAEFRSEELSTCYEALCEANLLDSERCDVWALLCLVHLRQENWDAADYACKQCLSLGPDCEELLLEVATELQRKDRQMSLAEACARRALESKDSGQAHSVLADVLAQMGKAEASVLEAQVSLKMLADHPELRKVIFAKALKLCQDLDDAPLTEALHACQKLADEQCTRRSPASGLGA
mmetsp:Transcript_9050/g.21671  ORF Transcript_9050/g.21671 Transcript_9050/m.21671 type:complete len:1021 (+) Transcript_9050:45-3107(+)